MSDFRKKINDWCKKIYCICRILCCLLIVVCIVTVVIVIDFVKSNQPDLLTAVMFLISALLCMFAFLCVGNSCNNIIKEKIDCLDFMLVFGGAALSLCLLYSFWKEYPNNRDFGDVAGVITAIGAFITARFIYLQFKGSKRQFSLTSFQNAFFALYDKIEIKYPYKHKCIFKGRTNEEIISRIPNTIGLLELIRLNLKDTTIERENADYYIDLVFFCIQNKKYRKQFSNMCAHFIDNRKTVRDGCCLRKIKTKLKGE